MEIILSIIILLIAFLGLSVGIIFDNKPLKGTCGGLNEFEKCSICNNDSNECNEKIIPQS